MTIPAISEGKFWSIIEEARKRSSGSADPKALAKVLTPLSDREASAFGHMSYEKLCKLNFWKLWAAGYIIAGRNEWRSVSLFRVVDYRDAMPRGQPFEEETVRKLCPTLASLFE